MKVHHKRFATSFFGIVILMVAVPSNAQTVPQSPNHSTGTVSSDHSEATKEISVTLSQTQPSLESPAISSSPQNVSTRIPLSSRIFAAPSMEQ